MVDKVKDAGNRFKLNLYQYREHVSRFLLVNFLGLYLRHDADLNSSVGVIDPAAMILSAKV